MKSTVICFIALSFAFARCDSSVLFEENKEIPNDTWDMNYRVAFEFDVPDTLTKYNLYFNIRNTDDYPFSNLYIFSHINFPNGKTGVDTVELPLTNPDGSWIGNGQGDIHDCQLMFRKDVRFPVAGKYKMELEQAMRMEKLPGIKDVGIRIERAE